VYNDPKGSKMQNPKRTLLIGLVVGLLFFGWWFRGFLYINWNFNLFSGESWRFLFQEINAGWRVSSAGDWIFLISFVLVIPMYLGIWYWANKIQWGSSAKKVAHLPKKHIQHIKKKISTPPKKSEHKTPAHTLHKPIKAPPISAQRPMPMPTMGPTMRSQPVQQQSFAQSNPMPAEMPNSYTPSPMANDRAFTPDTPMDTSWNNPLEADLKQMADMPLEEIQLPPQPSVDENPDELLSNTGWSVLSDVTSDEKASGFVAVCQGQMLWARYDDIDGDWLADEEAFNDEDPLWFSETDHRVSPVFELMQTGKLIAKKLSDAGFDLKVQPMLIERKGNIINAEDMLRTWNDLGVMVCRTDKGGPVELKTLSEVLNKQYEPLSDDAVEQLRQILL
jgi:hypothetical protein